MTDARFPERWLNDRRILRLTDAEFRFFMLTLAWSVSNRTDGYLEPEDLGLIPGVSAISEQSSAMERAGLWEGQGRGWLIADFRNTQTTSTQLAGLEHRRELDRERQARKRKREREETVVSEDVTRDVTRDTKARPGQDRQGREQEYDEPPDEPEWPEVVQPGSDVIRCFVCSERLTSFRAGNGYTTCTTHDVRDPKRRATA